jgi:hypothetical protein
MVRTVMDQVRTAQPILPLCSARRCTSSAAVAHARGTPSGHGPQVFFAPAVLTATVGIVTLASTGSVDYAKHRIASDAIHPLGQMWMLWGGGVACNYVTVARAWQPPFAAALAVAWTALVSARVHRPTEIAAPWDSHRIAAYLRESRGMEK